MQNGARGRYLFSFGRGRLNLLHVVDAFHELWDKARNVVLLGLGSAHRLGGADHVLKVRHGGLLGLWVGRSRQQLVGMGNEWLHLGHEFSGNIVELPFAILALFFVGLGLETCKQEKE